MDDFDQDVPLDFLSRIFPDTPWALAAIEPFPERSNARVEVLLATPQEQTKVKNWLAKYNNVWNLYFIVNTTAPNIRTSPLKSEITQVRALHVDVDFSSIPTQEDWDEALSSIRNLTPPPTVIINSGGGYQAFWLFDKPLPTDTEEAYGDRVESVNQAIARYVNGGDHCHNVNRLMRLPGTMNVLNKKKLASGRAPARTFIVEADYQRRWSFRRDAIPKPNGAEETIQAIGEYSAAAHNRTFDDLPARLKSLIQTGDASKYKGNRSALVDAIVAQLVRAGWTPDEIEPFLVDPMYGSSGHCRDQPAPTRAARRQIERITAQVRRGWTTNAAGVPLKNDTGNITKALDELGIRLSYDRFSCRNWVNGSGPARLLSDLEARKIRFDIEPRCGFLPDKLPFSEVLENVCYAHAYHPILDYLSSLKWDGVNRIDKFLVTYGQAEDTAYTRAVGKLMLLAAVRRIRQPGAKFDEMVVLVNRKQGTKKSEFLKYLAVRDEWFTDQLSLRAQSKEIIEQASGKWIIEIAELNGQSARRVEEIKVFLSSQYDKARMSYAHFADERPRQFIMIGTSNPTHFLIDTTGNRRFWPVRVGEMDNDAIIRDRDQIWAEAAALEATGVSIRLDPSLWLVAEREQQRHSIIEPWEDQIVDYIGDKNGRMRCADVYKLIDLPGGAGRGTESQRRLSGIMERLGWERTIAKFNGITTRCYERGSDDDRRCLIDIYYDPIKRAAVVYRRTGPNSPATQHSDADTHDDYRRTQEETRYVDNRDTPF